MSRYRSIFALLIIPFSLIAQDIDEAIRLFNISQYGRAREIFTEVIKDEKNPRVAEAFYYVGRLSINPDTALYYYAKVINDYSQSRYADISYLEIAKIHIARKNYENAVIALNELLRNFPDSGLKDEVWFWLGVSHISNGQEDRGIEILKNLRAKYPKSIWSERAITILPTEDKPDVPKQYFTVQVGSYRNKKNAERHAAEMREMKYEPVQIVKALVKGNTYFRVWVGSFPSIEEAKTFSATLQQKGIKGNVVKGY